MDITSVPGFKFFQEMAKYPVIDDDPPSHTSSPILIPSFASVPKPLVLVQDDIKHKKVERIGEAKNPGPEPFRGDMVKVHHCGKQLQALRSRVSTSAKPQPTRVSKGTPAKKGVAKAAQVYKPRAGAMATCFTCGKVGHLQAECKVGPPRCRTCNKVGHMQKDCKQGNSDKVKQLQSHIDKATHLHAEMMRAQRTGIPVNSQKRKK